MNPAAMDLVHSEKKICEGKKWFDKFDGHWKNGKSGVWAKEEDGFWIQCINCTLEIQQCLTDTSGNEYFMVLKVFIKSNDLIWYHGNGINCAIVSLAILLCTSIYVQLFPSA